jgi:peroxiredoxin
MTPRWLAILLALGVTAWAGTADEDWAAVTALDRGPQTAARSAAEAKAAVGAHLDEQEKALRNFSAAHPQDARTFEARLRLARLLEIRGGFQGSEKARAEAKQLLDALEKTATPEQRVEIDFARVTRLMRGAQKAPGPARDELLRAARTFRAEHPGDRRAAMLLVEVATLFDQDPKVKAALLNDAKSVATDPDVQGRIADDLHRLDLLGTRLAFGFRSVQGAEVKVADFLGRPVVIVFFADFSPPSTEALERVQRDLATLPKNTVAALGISLDPKREALDSALRAAAFTWPVAFDGKSWEGELVRSLSINALPTVWLLDKTGRLRSLNALEDLAEKVRQLARE